MIIIVNMGSTIAKFEKWEGNKAMDWITAKGLFRKNLFYMDGNAIWVTEKLP